MATIRELVARKAKLEQQLAAVLEELSKRDGETDEDPDPPVGHEIDEVETATVKRPAARTTATRTTGS
jgi:hypothetical protein